MNNRYAPRGGWTQITKATWAVLLAGLVTLVALWCQPNSFLWLMQNFLHQPLLILLNALPVGLVLLTFACLCSNVFYGAAITNLIVGSLSIANRVKIDIRNEPVFPRDLTMLQEVGGAASSYAINFPVTSIAVVLGLSALLFAMGYFLKASSSQRSWTWRIAGGAGSFAVLSVLTLTLFSSNTIYNGFTTTNPYYVPSVFNELGFPYCFTHHVTTYPVDKPSGFSKGEAAAWAGETTPSDGAPVNVIVVMNEAFSAIAEHDVFTYTPDTDPMKTFHQLSNRQGTISGKMVIPGFAGGTANTEFDVMTGIQTNALSPVTTSSFRVVNRDLDSLFRVFATDGYYTSYAHPGDCWFYNRENVLDFMGADSAQFVETMTDLDYKGRWVTDAYCVGLIQEHLAQAKAQNKPLFHYCTTIQNHMSYTADKYGEDYTYPELETTAEFTDEVETLLKVYIEGVRDADAMLKTLVDDFSQRNEPVVLVYYGDHLPYLGDNRTGYTQMGLDYALDEHDQENPVAAYEVPYLIWGNDAAHTALTWSTVANLPDTISASFLGSVILELTGRGDNSPWFDFLGDLRQELPVVQKNYAVDASGNGLWELSPDQKALVDQWRKWSYYKLKYEDFE